MYYRGAPTAVPRLRPVSNMLTSALIIKDSIPDCLHNCRINPILMICEPGR
jgi:hypothetical protein